MKEHDLYSDSYEYALDLDEHYKKTYGTELDCNVFSNLTEVLQYPLTHTGQKKYFEFFKTLHPNDLIERLSKLVVLIRLLAKIEKNKSR